MMKFEIYNYRILLLVLVGSMVLGCAKESDDSDRAATDFKVSIEKGTVDEGEALSDEFASEKTKTALNLKDYVCWSVGDKVYVNGDGVSSIVDVVPAGSDATTAVLSGTIPPENDHGIKYFGCYPASADYWDLSSGKLVKLPAEQTYNAASPLSNVPMYAESNDRHLVFKNLFGLMEFRVIGNRTVKSIKLTSTGDEYIAGTFTIDSKGKAVYSANGSKTVTLKVNPGIKMGGTGGLCFYIPVPAQTYSGLTVELTTEESATVGGEDFHKTIGSYTVLKGMLYANKLDSEPMSIQFWSGGPRWATVAIGITKYTQKPFAYCWGAFEVIYTGSLPDARPAGVACSFKSTNPESSTKIPNWNGSKGFATRNAPWGSASDGYTGTYTKYANDGDVLSDDDNTAIAKWGSVWDMPDVSDADNLNSKCNFTWVTNYDGSGWDGILLTSKSDASKTLFLPAYGWNETLKHYYENQNCEFWTKRSAGANNAYRWGGSKTATGTFSGYTSAGAQRCDARPILALRRD